MSEKALEITETNAITIIELTTEDYRDAWLEDLERRNYSRTTITTYKQAWAKFEAFRNKEKPSEEVVEKWIAHLRKEGKSPATIRLWKSGLSSFYKWGKKKFKKSKIEDPTNIDMPRKEKSKVHKRSTLSNNEVLAVLATCDDSVEGVRDKFVLSLLVYCGVRGVEIVRANAKDLRTEGGRQLLYVRGKGSEEADDFVVLPAPVEVALLEWQKVRERIEPLVHGLGHRNRGRLLTTWLRAMVKRRFAEAGVINGTKSTHSLRHTAITNAILNGGTPLQVMAMARHKSVDQTMQYFHQLERLKAPAEDLIIYS